MTANVHKTDQSAYNVEKFMSKKLRVFIWGAILLMGVSVTAETAWTQLPGSEDVVVLPQRRRKIRSVGGVFRDCSNCPEMVVLPAGSFLMGSVRRGMDTNPGREEMPSHPVTIGQYIAVGRYEVTFAQWNACVAEGGCNDYEPYDEKWGKGNRPVINVNWNEAQNYIYWLSRKTGKSYRLLSEAEWEYAARAGTPTSNYWGDDHHPESSVICTYANIGQSNFSCAKNGQNATVPVGSFRPNPFGLYDMIGNVQEVDSGLLESQLQRCACRWSRVATRRLHAARHARRRVARLLHAVFSFCVTPENQVWLAKGLHWISGRTDDVRGTKSPSRIAWQ